MKKRLSTCENLALSTSAKAALRRSARAWAPTGLTSCSEDPCSWKLAIVGERNGFEWPRPYLSAFYVNCRGQDFRNVCWQLTNQRHHMDPGITCLPDSVFCRSTKICTDSVATILTPRPSSVLIITHCSPPFCRYNFHARIRQLFESEPPLHLQPPPRFHPWHRK